MNININYNSRIPIYEQIVSEIERLVSLNILKPDSQIPSIRELACTLGINPNTVKKSYDILEFDLKLGRISVGRSDFYGYRRRTLAILNNMLAGKGKV